MKYCVEPQSKLNNVSHGHYTNISSLCIVLLSFNRERERERERGEREREREREREKERESIGGIFGIFYLIEGIFNFLLQ